jgi:hypothetical protein
VEGLTGPSFGRDWIIATAFSNCALLIVVDWSGRGRDHWRFCTLGSVDKMNAWQVIISYRYHHWHQDCRVGRSDTQQTVINDCEDQRDTDSGKKSILKGWGK